MKLFLVGLALALVSSSSSVDALRDLSGSAESAYSDTVSAQRQRLARRQATVPADCNIINSVWTGLMSGASSLDCCTALPAVITCVGGRVTELDLTSKPIYPLTAAIQGLTELKILVAPGVDVSGVVKAPTEGSIPTEIGMLTKLVKIDLAQNGLQGKIPTELGKLTALTWLYRVGEKFIDRVDSTADYEPASYHDPVNANIFKAAQTQHLNTPLLNSDVSYNRLSGSSAINFPTSYPSSLRTLAVDHNLFTGPAPALPPSNVQPSFGYNCFDKESPANPNCNSGSGSGNNTVAPVAPTTPNPTTPDSNSSSGGNSGAIIGGAVGGVAVLALGIVGFFVYRRSQAKEAPAPPPVVVPLHSYDAEFGPSPGQYNNQPQQQFNGQPIPYNAGGQYGAQQQQQYSNGQPQYYQPNGPAGGQRPPSSRGSFMPPYAASESGQSQSTDPRGAVQDYRILPDVGRRYPTDTDNHSSNYGGDEKASQLGRSEPSFLDSQFSSGTNPSRAGPNYAPLDEKAVLRAAQGGGGSTPVPHPSHRREASPLPEKNAYLFNSQQPSIPASVHSNDPGALPEKDPILFGLGGGNSVPAVGRSNSLKDPKSWTVEEAAAWAEKIDRIGGIIAAKIREQGITGDILIQISREDMRTDFGLAKLGDRAEFETHLKILKSDAGLDGDLSTDAPLPPSYQGLFRG
ncbi:hypothetical protein CcCBS67573_g00860 [Chytriomyces confervae]|uniref:SAM domain-containing protein n=1 Tax=Chytriomyces confervae TaxID=246404 RepID=A0A507FSJ6_9FUNG|nr:hypothetical protein CcCBS67573_g00860 [Chytriomyces confervae]